jgi:hypothetical protein
VCEATGHQRPESVTSLQTMLWFLGAVLAIITRNVFAVPFNVSRVYQFPEGTWIENFCVRSNGNLVLSRYDTAEVYELDPLAQNPTPELLYSFVKKGATGVAGCAETSPDVFVVIVQTPVPRSILSYKFAVWSIEFSSTEEPKFTQIVSDVPGARFLNGLASPSPSAIMITDTLAGVIHHVDLHNSVVSIPIKDAGIGVNGIRARGNFVYTSNLITGAFRKIPIDITTGASTGPAVIVAQDAKLLGSDDFALGNSGDEAFICNFVLNQVLRVDREGHVDVVAGSVGSQIVPAPTAARFGRANADERTLYVTTSGNVILPVPFVGLGGGGQVIAVRL